MKKQIVSITAVCLVLALLTGCAGIADYFRQLGQLLGGEAVKFTEMEYTRPDMTHFQQVLEQCCEEGRTQTDIQKLEQSILEFYDVYGDFYTNYFLANIYYSKDLTDSYWEAENTFCMENSAEADAGLDQLYRTLAKSPLRETLEGEDYFGPGFFEDYEGESLYDETFHAMLDQETALINQYYAVSGQSGNTAYYSEEYFSIYGTQMAEIFRDLVQLRQEMAAYAGYDNYPDFAYDFHHARDYTVWQASTYLQQIQGQLTPLYIQLNRSGFWNMKVEYSSEQQTLDYVEQMAKNMGGVIQEAYRTMVDRELYDIRYSPQKFNASFSVYLYTYQAPYVFVNPSMTERDKLTLTHEFGHFANYYAGAGSNAGVDVSEVFSQGLEYLSLCYGEDIGNLEKIRMASCLNTYVEQAAYASFEQMVYDLEGEELTVENIQQLYTMVGASFGFTSWNWDPRDYVCITHFFTSPMYIISYVVSNDAALQLYQMEQAETGSGLRCYMEHLNTQEVYLQAFLTSAGLESPFAPGRLDRVKETLETILK